MQDERSALLSEFNEHYGREIAPDYKAHILRLLKRYLPVTGALSTTSEEIVRYFRAAGHKWSLSYLRKMHGAATNFFDWAQRTGRMSYNPMKGTPRAIDYWPDKAEKVEPHLFLEYATHLRSINRSADTVVQRVGDIRRFAGENGPLDVTPEMLGDYLQDNKLKWSQEYRRKIRASFVSFYGWAFSEGYIASDPTLTLKSIRPGIPPRSPIVEKELFAAFYSADLETQAIIALAASLGLRRMEITVLHTRARVERNLTVHGKGDRIRIVPLNDLCYGLLRDLEGRHGRGYYFRNQRTGHHLHHSTIYKHAKAYIGSWCLHALRHRAATVGLRRGGNIREIQELLGHLSLSTTQVYAAVSLEELSQVTSSTSWSRDRNESSNTGNTITVDLNNLSGDDAARIAEALSRSLHRRTLSRAA